MRRITALSATVLTMMLSACSGSGSGATGETNTPAGLSAAQLADLDPATLRNEPVMFSVTDDDSEVILYGTFHLLPQDTQWESDTLDAALARSDEAWFELPKGAMADPSLQQLTLQLGLSDTPLAARLSEADLALLTEKAGTLGIDPAMFGAMQPWLAAITLTGIQAMSQGFDPSAGVEAVLEPRVDGLGRRSFETAEQQLRIFADMDENTQIALLRETLKSFDEGPDLLSRMATAWASGDVDMLESEVIGDAKASMPAVYDAMFTQRNAAWADALDAELAGAGTDFVAVGAGHLLGPDSVPVMLAKRGYTVRVLTAE